MYRPVLTCAFLVFASTAFAQQQSSPSDPYQGQSNPPADDVIVATQPDQPADAPKAKPQAGKPVTQAQPQVPAPLQGQPSATAGGVPQGSARLDDSAAQGSSADRSANYQDPDVNGTDDGMVQVARPQQALVNGEPALTPRGAAIDPDEDIVHPHPLRPGELADGTTIRVHLLTRLSTADSQQGEAFRTQVASDVLQDGKVLIPAGAEIDGRVVQVSSGTARSHGTMLLRPETVILPDGTRYHMDAQVTGTPGAKAHVSSEGFIDPGSRLKKDSMYYGGAVGTGVVTGALIAGPVGAVTGGIIGAGAMTVRVMTNHSEATLEPGTVLLFTLDNRLDLQAANPAGD
jgi:type IV secretory pathway VirB10-like protein